MQESTKFTDVLADLESKMHCLVPKNKIRLDECTQQQIVKSINSENAIYDASI